MAPSWPSKWPVGLSTLSWFHTWMLRFLLPVTMTFRKSLQQQKHHKCFSLTLQWLNREREREKSHRWRPCIRGIKYRGYITYSRSSWSRPFGWNKLAPAADGRGWRTGNNGHPNYTQSSAIKRINIKIDSLDWLRNFTQKIHPVHGILDEKKMQSKPSLLYG